VLSAYTSQTNEAQFHPTSSVSGPMPLSSNNQYTDISLSFTSQTGIRSSSGRSNTPLISVTNGRETPSTFLTTKSNEVYSTQTQPAAYTSQTSIIMISGTPSGYLISGSHSGVVPSSQDSRSQIHPGTISSTSQASSLETVIESSETPPNQTAGSQTGPAQTLPGSQSDNSTSRPTSFPYAQTTVNTVSGTQSNLPDSQSSSQLISTGFTSYSIFPSIHTYLSSSSNQINTYSSQATSKSVSISVSNTYSTQYLSSGTQVSESAQLSGSEIPSTVSIIQKYLLWGFMPNLSLHFQDCSKITC